MNERFVRTNLAMHSISLRLFHSACVWAHCILWIKTRSSIETLLRPKEISTLNAFKSHRLINQIKRKIKPGGSESEML